MIAFVVLTFAGIIPQHAVTLGDSPSHVRDALATSSMTKMYVGYYIEFIAALVFLAAMLLLARLVRGEGEMADWLEGRRFGVTVDPGADVELAKLAALAWAEGYRRAIFELRWAAREDVEVIVPDDISELDGGQG